MTNQETIPYLSEQKLSSLGITTEEVIASIESVIAGLEKQSAWSAPKAVIYTEDGRYMMAALAAADDPCLLAVKSLVLNPRNPERGLPQINGLVTLLDSVTGLPVAILDANWITAVRTAGLSATAARRMARRDSAVVAFVGCGVQARSHLKAFADLFPLREVRLFGRGQKNIDRLVRQAESLSLSACVCTSAKEAVTGADLIVSSVTYSATLTPFLDAAWLKPGAFAAITDLGAPWLPQSLPAFDRIIIDDLEQEAAMPNRLAPPELVTGDLSGLVLGRVAGRDDAKERNAFIFRGHAMGDLALSMLAWQRASKESA
ncbi:ornithine cyclodeaminase [Geothermobacter ehrlichii]|uniref:Ornithine cyclodeaminase n=1 Tax=Geothermobacter ehrlichii TaxID=213224 RepID=A0A5D3WHI5_9BACT|nr:ornithine cyclodeaminase family protein [Geothermobacter ehrlichii]TYO97529.1 ornithine cyclodeaminase [Geothermobacter ehrlichii]